MKWTKEYWETNSESPAFNEDIRRAIEVKQAIYYLTFKVLLAGPLSSFFKLASNGKEILKLTFYVPVMQ